MILFWGSKVKGQGHMVNKCNYYTNVRSITQKRMIPKCSNLIRNELGKLGYPASGMFVG